jgi:phospholipase D1/2
VSSHRRNRTSRIVVPGRNAWRQPRAASAGLLVDAKDYYTAFYRAALGARRYILLSGWQFDRGVQLLREKDVAYARPQGGEVRLLALLDGLCKARPDLEVYVLAWDFHVVFALEREWMQRMYFHWATQERLRFRFDDCHPPGGCHHQKFVVIDGWLSFLGGIDLCESRWDDRRHLAHNPARVSRGRPQKPYHDVQTYLTGRPVAAALTDLFCQRWKRTGGDPIRLPELPSPAGAATYRPRGALAVPPGPVALSRTDPRKTLRRSHFEIRQQLEDAIAAAERLIYIETQYFSSRRLCASLEQRLRRRTPRLQVVMVLNQRAEAVKEEIAVGLRQAQNLEQLRRVAAETGHALGAYYTVAEGRVPGRRGRAGEKPTYIHSKLTIVDDRYLNVGSANFTNRSMDLDTELNASWECRPGENLPLRRAIRAARVSLLAEHLGVRTSAGRRALTPAGDLVAHLDGLVARGRGRLRALPPPTAEQARALSIIDPRALPFDPESELDPEVAEAAQQRSLFRVGIRDLWQRVAGAAQRRSDGEPAAARLARRPGHMIAAQKR